MDQAGNDLTARIEERPLHGGTSRKPYASSPWEIARPGTEPAVNGSAANGNAANGYAGLGPFQELLADITAVAEGNPHHTITVSGPPPVSAIAAAVERMRVELLDRTPAGTAGAEGHEDWERRVRGVFDFAVQQFFLIGLALQSLAARNPSIAEVLQPLVDRTDAAIRDLRSLAVHLPSPG